MQARTPFLSKMGVNSYYSCGIRSEDHFCSLNELKETASCRQKQSFKKRVNEYATTHRREVLGQKVQNFAMNPYIQNN